MARKNKTPEKSTRRSAANVEGLRGEVLEQPITDTLETNFMPYAMSTIVSKAIPEIDGFKPSHRKLLYTMYKMGLLTGARTKSANIVGQTMHLNPHGDAAIYDTMVRLTVDNESLLHPFVDSKGSFGKVYSRDMAPAASRYTNAKLAAICAEIFRDIDRDTVDFVDSYDSSDKEPALLPTSYPNILVSSNEGIAVGMASRICGFNLEEVCRSAIAYMKNPDCDLFETLKAPDFPTGGELIFNREVMEGIYNTGTGSFKLRAVWDYVKEENIIEIRQIPYTTTAEAIIDKVAELVKAGKLKEISDMRDETDLNGLKLAIDLKRGVDPEKLMQRLFRVTPLMNSYACNFNILIAGMPRIMGVREILDEWTAWRIECVRRRTFFELKRKKARLHLLKGLGKILLDIDKAIAIIRNTEAEADVVPNLMIGFGIDSQQAEFVAEIKLRNINREYILRQIKDTEALEGEIADLEETVNSKGKIKKIIIVELENIIKKYAQPRKTKIIYENELKEPEPDEETEDYPVTVFISRHGYLKKITPLSLRMSGEQKFKEDDALMCSFEAANRTELLIFTDKCQVYKTRLSEFEQCKASSLGDYLPAKLQMDAEESIVYICDPSCGEGGDYKGSLVFFFENGKAARVSMSQYATKTNRRRLANAYSDRSPLKTVLSFSGERELVVYSTEGRALIIQSAQLSEKTTRDSQGVAVLNLKPRYKLRSAEFFENSSIKNRYRYTTKNIPAAGAILKPEDAGNEQLEL